MLRYFGMYTKYFEFSIENPVLKKSSKADPAKSLANSNNTYSKFLDLQVCQCNIRIYVCLVSLLFKTILCSRKYFTSIMTGIENQQCFTKFIRTKVIFVFLNRYRKKKKCYTKLNIFFAKTLSICNHWMEQETHYF